MAGNNNQRRAALLVGDGRIVNGSFRAIGTNRISTLLTAKHQIFNADIGKGSTCHHPVIAASTAVTIKIGEFNTVLQKVATGGRGLLDRTGGGDVVRRHGIAENSQRASAMNFSNRARFHPEVYKKRGFLNISALAVPIINISRAGWDLIPF